MIAFYRKYPDLFQIVPPPVAQLPETISASGILPQAAAKLPWAHQVVLLEKVKNLADRLWYMQAAVEHGWSRSVLTVQIEQRAHARAVTNFAATLPPLQSDLAQQTLKNPYLFDFLPLSPGFAFVGRQVHQEVGGEDF